MIPQILQKLKEHLSKYPDIGPRKAERYALFLLKQPQSTRQELIALVNALDSIAFCKQCFAPTENADGVCGVCNDPQRNKQSICVVEKETNIAPIEKTKIHNGVYLILGGYISPIHDSNAVKQRIAFLVKKLQATPKDQRKEVILALNNTREGNFTSLYIQEVLKKHPTQNTTTTTLGRGLASGNELEYLDQETLVNALKNRTERIIHKNS